MSERQAPYHVEHLEAQEALRQIKNQQSPLENAAKEERRVQTLALNWIADFLLDHLGEIEVLHAQEPQDEVLSVLSRIESLAEDWRQS